MAIIELKTETLRSKLIEALNCMNLVHFPHLVEYDRHCQMLIGHDPSVDEGDWDEDVASTIVKVELTDEKINHAVSNLNWYLKHQLIKNWADDEDDIGIDIDVADAIFQIALYDEIVFG